MKKCDRGSCGSYESFITFLLGFGITIILARTLTSNVAAATKVAVFVISIIMI